MVSTVETGRAKGVWPSAKALYRSGAGAASKLQWLGLLAARLLVARVFFKSGLTKWDGLTIREDAFYLFADEYFSKYALPAPLINTFAVAASIAELALPVLLALGLLTRAAAFGLLIMTLVIQLLVYPDAWWNVHAWWAAILVLIIVHGPGSASADRRLGLD